MFLLRLGRCQNCIRRHYRTIFLSAAKRPEVQFLGNPLKLSLPRRAGNAPKTKTPQTQGLSHGALVEQPLLREAVSSAQLIPCPRFDRLLRLDELSWALLYR
jgi:hypothetical protein